MQTCLLLSLINYKKTCHSPLFFTDIWGSSHLESAWYGYCHLFLRKFTDYPIASCALRDTKPPLDFLIARGKPKETACSSNPPKTISNGVKRPRKGAVYATLWRQQHKRVRLSANSAAHNIVSIKESSRALAFKLWSSNLSGTSISGRNKQSWMMVM